ncbi:hypothetical protein [Luteococcus sp.]|uniref:hypothetical protein n=1 Tax=Luteococcus sp. TaxID=1969402 RepID=UPI003735C389
MADLLDYLTHHPTSAPRLARAALDIATAMALHDWDADLWEDIAHILNTATTGHLPSVETSKGWKKALSAKADPNPVHNLSPQRYLVTWTVDIDDTHATVEDVARHALDMITRTGSIAHVFTVHDNHTAATTAIDLNELDSHPDIATRQENRH